jgi:hypothetical protein
MTRPGEALRLALRDLYRNSWRLLPLNALVGAVLVAVAVTAYAVRLAVVLVVLAGPAAAALVHAAVTLVRTGDLTLADGVDGLRRNWLRGLTLGACGSAFAFLGLLAVRFYAHSRFAWPLAFVALYLLVIAAIYLLVVWTLAIAEPERRLGAAARDAAELVARRPVATTVLGLALVLVNAAGVAAAVMPFLTLTVAYSFLAAAHFALTPQSPEENA